MHRFVPGVQNHWSCCNYYAYFTTFFRFISLHHVWPCSAKFPFCRSAKCSTLCPKCHLLSLILFPVIALHGPWLILHAVSNVSWLSWIFFSNSSTLCISLAWQTTQTTSSLYSTAICNVMNWAEAFSEFNFTYFFFCCAVFLLCSFFFLNQKWMKCPLILSS